MTITYEIFGAPIPDGKGGYDGFEIAHEFEYEVEVTDSDYIDYLMLWVCPPKGYTQEQARIFNEGAIAALSINLEFLKKSIDEDEFYEFMKERYTEAAYHSIQDWYDTYE